MTRPDAAATYIPLGYSFH